MAFFKGAVPKAKLHGGLPARSHDAAGRLRSNRQLRQGQQSRRSGEAAKRTGITEEKQWEWGKQNDLDRIFPTISHCFPQITRSPFHSGHFPDDEHVSEITRILPPRKHGMIHGMTGIEWHIHEI